MKRFIITNLLAIMVLPMLACAGGGTTNYYLFSVYEPKDFDNRMDQITRDNWKAYLGLGEKDWFWFNAEDIIKAAKDKNDALMASYVENLQKYLDCCHIEQRKMYEWNYPTKEEIDDAKQAFQAIRTYASSKLKTRLRSQHALLYMRCNMLLGRHQDNVSFWEQTASQYIETVYKDMMKNIYAGALYKTGKEEQAGELFAEMGDYNSLMTIYYKKRSYFAIQRQYRLNPNAKVLPFLLQDFVNNAQEADDATNPNAEGVGGKLFIRDISKSEALQMITFCEQVVREGKTETPALWKSAKAWLEFMFSSKEQALADITEAMAMAGTERMKDDARVLRLYINSAIATQDANFERWLQDELSWLNEKSKDDDFFQAAMHRISHQTLKGRYASDPVKAVALLNVTGNYEYGNYIDTMKVENLEKYYFLTIGTPKTDFERFLKQNIKKEEEYVLEDLIGTKYMRLCQWDKAIVWLENIPTTFYENRGYAVYAANRVYSRGPWIKRQWITSEMEYGDNKWKFSYNPKLNFVREMQNMEGELNVLSGEALKKQYYELAVRYAQASYTGDCWWLMRDFKSVCDTVRVNEVDLAAKAASLLKKAGEPKDFLLKEKVLCARAYVYMNPSPWYTLTWNSETYEYDRHPDPSSAAYKAFAALAEFEKQHPDDTSGYISNCDEYQLFLQNYRN